MKVANPVGSRPARLPKGRAKRLAKRPTGNLDGGQTQSRRRFASIRAHRHVCHCWLYTHAWFALPAWPKQPETGQQR